MSDLGKIDRSFFDERVASSLGADRDDVSLGPRHGVDFGVLDVGGRAVVTATDPLSIVPDLGLERAARFALDLVLADVAVSGVPPSHLSICFTLPPAMSDADFTTVWETIHEECADLGVGVVTGHTARYADCSYPWVGAATALGVGNHDRLVRPDGARVGDRLVVTTGPGAETVGLLSTLFGDRLELPAETVDTARERLEDVYCVRDALTAAAAGPVTAMHDVTEGGLAGALNEMAAGSDTRFSLERDRVPVRPGVEAVCEHLGIDPWHVTSCGTLVVACDPDGVDDVVGALEARGTVAADVGRVEAGEGVFVDGERLAHPDVDPSWEAYATLAEES
ncbi:AIR synthase family protein [Natrononativus amylolyticus]|uniref:AIR synthase family protein n=1 Tax=Natrononativus amylolyticus TaxID=2963434 RepID=UPI0020CF50F7|nr:AIR synthase family protein [Natrononativus amylolyticus]